MLHTRNSEEPLFLGLSVVALWLVIWLVVLLVSDPKGVVRDVLTGRSR